MLTRRTFLSSIAATAATFPLSSLTMAHTGIVSASSEGLVPGSTQDQGSALQSILDKASSDGKAVFLEPGRYRISNVTLPKNTNLQGVHGSTTLEYAGGEHFVYSEGAENISLSGIRLDGGLLPTAGYAESLLRIRDAKQVWIEKCAITNAAAIGSYISGSSGKFVNNTIDSAIGTAAIYALDNSKFEIASNTIEECGNNGILVHRSSIGEDNTIITSNRIRQISALNGGTGPWGNGINTYRANGVIVNGNHISDCAFSTIRSNSCSNIQISDNTCLRVGETSIYSEFAFEGASITGNIVDGAALGISIANFLDGGRLSVCANNIVRNMHNHIPYPEDGHIHGSGISVEADTSVTGNVIENVPRFGLLLGWGPYLRNVNVNANVVHRANIGVYVSAVEGVGPVSIHNNTLSKVKAGGVVGHNWHDVATGDLAAPGARKVAGISVQNNQVT
ncbi:MAG: TIGR03808 family TAT-translocated repetitive protein [Pseudomonadota bacterium]